MGNVGVRDTATTLYTPSQDLTAASEQGIETARARARMNVSGYRGQNSLVFFTKYLTELNCSTNIAE